MKTKLIAVALLASAALIAPLQAGNHGGGGGGFVGGGHVAARGGGGPSFGSMPAGRFGGGPAFRSMPTRSFGGNRMIYSNPRFSSVSPRSPRSMEFRPGQLAQANNNRADRVSRLANGGNQSLANVKSGRSGQFRNSTNQFRNGNSTLRSDWRNHAFAQHSANWHRDWDRHHDHFFHGHRFVFIDGFWWGFGLGFDPWWYYPYDYYGYGYVYPNSYDSGYDQSEESYDQGGYADQSANSTVAAVQERLAREGFYRGQIDGVFGPETYAALAQFQTNHGLRASGALTNDTLAALGLRRVAS
ncbi:MAG TPA: peptidoglycan-binding domain-containing protein [Chthoniobacterales bacterium]|nr:peptidoglycan-binding domain-containing protein [Chthoniobacterales bacterium]